MKSIEITGKTVDEAIFKGLDEMGLSIDEVDIEILDEGGKRLFGIGTKPCKIKLTERDRETVEQTLRQAKEQEEAEKRQKEARKAARRDDRRSYGDRERSDRDRGDRGERRPRERQPRPPRQDRQARPAAAGEDHARRERRGRESEPAKPFFEGEPAEFGQEGDFLKGVLERMGVECEISCLVNKEMDTKCFQISGKGMGVLIGRRGETLNALQYLCSLVANKGDSEYHRIIVDTENYRGRREGALIKLAENKAGLVKKTGKSVRLEPMNPYDRRVLHAALQNNPNVKTHSEGDEPNRRVVISKK